MEGGFFLVRATPDHLANMSLSNVTLAQDLPAALVFGSSTLSLASCLVVLVVLLFNQRGFKSLPALHQFVCLLLTDVVYSAAWIASTAIQLERGAGAMCSSAGALLNFAALASFFWSGALAVQLTLESLGRQPSSRLVLLGVSHLVCWGVPLIATLVLQFYAHAFGPTGLHCWLMSGTLRIACFYAVIASIVVFNCVCLAIVQRRNSVDESKRSRRGARALIIYAVTFALLWVIPFGNRLYEMLRDEVQPGLMAASAFLMPLQGLADAVVFVLLLKARQPIEDQELIQSEEFPSITSKPTSSSLPSKLSAATKILVVCAFLFQSASRGSLASLSHRVSVFMPPVFLNSLRTAMGGLMFMILMVVFRLLAVASSQGYIRRFSPAWQKRLEESSRVRLSWNIVYRLSVFAFLQSQLPFALLVWSGAMMSSAISSVLIATMPLNSVWISRLAGNRTPILWNKVAAIIVGLAGVSLVTLGSISYSNSDQGTDLAIGVTLAALAAVVWSCGSVYGEKLGDIPQIPRACFQCIIGSFMSMAVSLVWEFGFGVPLLGFPPRFAFVYTVPPEIWGELLALAVSTLFFGMICLLFLLDTVGAVVTSCFSFLVPVFGLLAQLILQGPSAWDDLATWEIGLQVLGCLVIMSSMVFLIWPTIKDMVAAAKARKQLMKGLSRSSEGEQSMDEREHLGTDIQ